MLAEFIGQERVKKQLSIVIQEGRMRSRLPHIGLFGKSGQGKTLLANLIAQELNAKLIYMNSTAIKSPIAFLTEVYKAKEYPSSQYIVFLDECHTLPKLIQENMLSVLEEPGMLCMLAPKVMRHNGKDIPKGSSIKIKIPDNISFILGTTHKGHLRETILNRLVNINLADYTEEEGVKILRMNANMQFPESILKRIVRMSKNVREMKKHLRAFEAYLQLNKCTALLSTGKKAGFNLAALTLDNLKEFCLVYGVDEDGCNDTDIEYMELLYEHDRVGLNSMVSMLGVSVEEIKNVVEPFLLKRKYILITPRGRTLTPQGVQRIGKQAENSFDLVE